MKYEAKHDIPFGVGWNSGKNHAQGWPAVTWACKKVKGLKIVRTFEIPFANASGNVVTPDSCREFGGDIMNVVYLLTKEEK